jgi:hypothetical protein
MPVESLSHLIASVFILRESITAINRKLFSENDEAQAQKLNQCRIIKKLAFFIEISTVMTKISCICRKTEKILHILSRNIDIWVGFLKFAFFVEGFVWQNEKFSPSVHFGGILDNGFVFKLYIFVANSIVKFNNLSKSGP